ncbi:MAG: hypothetical protein ACOZBH_04425 [Patescibacteria group bacterium]
MKIIFYSSNSQFVLLDNEFVSFIKELETKKRVWIPRLKVFLSDMFIWAGDKPPDKTKGYLHDGTYVEKRMGKWIDPLRPEINLDYKYYPELAKDEILTELEYFGTISKTLNTKKMKRLEEAEFKRRKENDDEKTKEAEAVGMSRQQLDEIEEELCAGKLFDVSE